MSCIKNIKSSDYEKGLKDGINIKLAELNVSTDSIITCYIGSDCKSVNIHTVGKFIKETFPDNDIMVMPDVYKLECYSRDQLKLTADHITNYLNRTEDNI